MVIRIPTPGDVLGFAKSTASWAVDSATALAGAPARALGLLDGAESLLARVHEVVGRVEELLERTDGLVDEARGTAEAAATTVAEAQRISAAAEALVNRAAGIADEAARSASTADQLLQAYAPIARRGAPLADRFVSEISDKEVDAAIRLVDELPVLTEHVLTDVLPILRTLDRVGPEIHELLEVTHDVRRAIVGIPGFQFFRKRGEERVSEEEVAKPETDHYDPKRSAENT
ncbi:hypothetical protein [Saccharopolyspora sp. CA-218241]|uniref:hypothetical protein n=1 Tax=Saccharopolyspora sp. CA-218241 TaxID=3240027 RepID=UPI003D9753A1